MLDLRLEVRQPAAVFSNRNGSWALPRKHTSIQVILSDTETMTRGGYVSRPSDGWRARRRDHRASCAMGCWRARRKRGTFHLPAARMARTAVSGRLMQLSFALYCLIDLKAKQKERDDRVVVHASRPMGARHRTPRVIVSVSDKIT